MEKFKKIVNSCGFLIIMFSIIIFLENCTENEENRKIEITENPTLASLEDFFWLEGIWKDSITFGFKSPPEIMYEEWKIYDDSLSGLAYVVIANDTTINERFSIVKTEKQIVYVARPVGQSIIGFPFKGIADGQYIFENKAHDFPQKIGYHFKKNDSLDIYLEGVANTVNRKIKFTFVKI